MPSQIQPQQLKWSTGSLTATTNVSTVPVQLWGGKNSFQVNLTGSGTVSVTATLEVSNDGVTWIPITASALSLSGTNSDTDGLTIDAAWVYARITLSSITGTGATATAFMGGGGA